MAEGVMLVLATGMLMVLALVGLGIFGVWWSVRSVRRSRVFTRGTLIARQVTAPNRSAREIGRLRVALYDSVTATSRVLTEVPAPSVLQHLSADLHRVAAVTDQRLALLASEPDEQVLRRLLPGLRDAVVALTRDASEVRGTAWIFATELDQPHRSALALEVADQVAGLRAGLAQVQAIRSTAGL
jgi:hypothetical protein